MGTQPQNEELREGAVKTFSCVLMSPSSGHLIWLIFRGKIPLVHLFIYSFNKVLPAISGGKEPRGRKNGFLYGISQPVIQIVLWQFYKGRDRLNWEQAAWPTGIVFSHNLRPNQFHVQTSIGELAGLSLLFVPGLLCKVCSVKCMFDTSH